jgi:hypothetical protein
MALVTAGVEMDVLGIAFSEFIEAQRMTEEIMDERETSPRAIGGAPDPGRVTITPSWG